MAHFGDLVQKTAMTITTSNFGNKDVHERIGTKVYDKYMQELRTTEPQGFPKEMHELPPAPTADEIEKDPSTLCLYLFASRVSALSYDG